MQLKGNAAIVTGGASGLGAETARYLAKGGAKVAVVDRNAELAQAVAKEIGGVAITCNVADAEEGVNAIAKAREAHGPARILINCAGIGGGRRIVGRDGPYPLEAVQAHHRRQPDRHLQHDAPCRRRYEHDGAARRQRARCHHLDRVGRRVRGPGRPGGLFRVEGRHRRR